MKNKQFRELGLFLLLMAVTFFLWDHVLFYPLKILVVFFHESSHAIATIASGGQVKEFEVVAQAGGHVVSIGGNRFVTLTAGYLGSLVWGLIIFSIAVLTNFDRYFMALIGLVLVSITLAYGSNQFVLIFGVSTGLAMVASAKFLPLVFNDFLLRLIGLTSMFYVPMDIYRDTIVRSNLRSDAFMLAEYVGGTTIMWGAIWLVISVGLIFICLHWLFVRRNPINE